MPYQPRIRLIGCKHVTAIAEELAAIPRCLVGTDKIAWKILQEEDASLWKEDLQLQGVALSLVVKCDELDAQLMARIKDLEFVLADYHCEQVAVVVDLTKDKGRSAMTTAKILHPTLMGS